MDILPAKSCSRWDIALWPDRAPARSATQAAESCTHQAEQRGVLRRPTSWRALPAKEDSDASTQ